MNKEQTQSINLFATGRDWKILLWDQVEEVHTELYATLRSLNFHGKGVELISATNLEIARILVDQHPDLALVLIGDTETDPFALVDHIRSVANYSWSQILLCQGGLEGPDVHSQEVQGYLNHRDLFGGKAKKQILTSLKAYEGQINLMLRREDNPNAPQGLNQGRMTIVRWRDKPNWEIEYISLNVVELLGYDGSALTEGDIGFDYLVFPSDIDRIEFENKDCALHGQEHYIQQYRMLRKDGRVIWVSDHTTIVYDEQDEIVHYVSYLNDITEKKEQERLLFEGELFGVVELDLNERVIEINQTAADILRINPETALGKEFKSWIDPDMIAAIEESFASAKEQKRPQRFESYLNRAKGSETPCQFTLAPQPGPSGEVEGVLVILEDLTEKKKIEDDLRDSLAAEKAFIASVSHEMRTPLASILGYTELLKNTGVMTDEQRQFVESVDLNSNHLLNLINDILDISKLESNQLSLNPQEVIFADLFAACGVVVSSKVKEGVKLNVNIPDFDYYIKCDPVRIKQIFINLLSNAAKFTDTGAIYLYLKDMTPLENDLISMRISVEDTGIGISKNKQEELFQPFKQAHIGDYGGTGLGLYLSRSIAKLMDGDITVESELGKGSTFMVEMVLPRGRLKESDFDFSQTRMLVVGDYPSLSDHQKTKLLETQAKLEFVDGTILGRELATKILECELADVAIIDVDVLKNRAAYVAGLIKDCQPQVRVLGIKTKSMGIESRDFDAFLLKPFSYFQLGSGIKKLLGNEEEVENLDFSGLSILMAEDASANRMLYQQMFKKFFQVELKLAENGQQAKEMVKSESFDLVLMDLQMPVLDGLSATREIRAFDKITPIVALTGSVFAEVLKKCSQAGMNGYLAKPVQKEELVKLLRDVSKGVSLSLNVKETPKAQPKMALAKKLVEKPKTKDTPMTDHMREFLESMGSPAEVVDEILNSAVTEVTECYLGALKNLEDSDSEGMQRHLHKLKGLLMNFELSKESELVKDLELLVKDGADETLIEARMESFLERFKEFER